MSLLETYRVSATFFVLGWVADTYPDVVRMIADRGHEVASHGYWHAGATSLSPAEFREDTTRALDAIARRGIERPIGYRAPNFSIVEKTLWALEILAELRLRYDSSVYPASRRRYGIATYPLRVPHRVQLRNGGFIREFPLAARKVWRLSVPVAGGGYLRLYPSKVTEAYIRSENARSRPVVVYLHPWDLDVDQPRVAVNPWARFLAYSGLGTTERKLESLLRQFEFGTIRDGLDLADGASVDITKVR